jgi:hypothetical protein
LPKNLHEDGKEIPLLQDLQQTRTKILTKLELNVFQQKRKKLTQCKKLKSKCRAYYYFPSIRKTQFY